LDVFDCTIDVLNLDIRTAFVAGRRFPPEAREPPPNHPKQQLYGVSPLVDRSEFGGDAARFSRHDTASLSNQVGLSTESWERFSLTPLAGLEQSTKVMSKRRRQWSIFDQDPEFDVQVHRVLGQIRAGHERYPIIGRGTLGVKAAGSARSVDWSPIPWPGKNGCAI
jgi:hypothetical protein